jgi:FkbM family methyltransferase
MLVFQAFFLALIPGLLKVIECRRLREDHDGSLIGPALAHQWDGFEHLHTDLKLSTHVHQVKGSLMGQEFSFWIHLRPEHYKDRQTTLIHNDKGGIHHDCEFAAVDYLKFKEKYNAEPQKIDEYRYVDVGANVGSCVLLMIALGVKHLEIFEPMPANLFYLTGSLLDQRNENLNHTSIILYPFGLGDEKVAQVNLYTSHFDSGSSVVAVNPHENGQFYTSTVSLYRLDDIYHARFQDMRTIPDIDILKVDVEGFELKFLHGAKQMLRGKRIRKIKMEVSPGELKRHKGTARHIYDILSSFGYVANMERQVMGGKDPKNHLQEGDFAYFDQNDGFANNEVVFQRRSD